MNVLRLYVIFVAYIGIKLASNIKDFDYQYKKNIILRKSIIEEEKKMKLFFFNKILLLINNSIYDCHTSNC